MPNVSLHENIATPEQKLYVLASPRNRIIHFIKPGEIQNLKNFLEFFVVQQILNKKQILRPSQLSETAKLCSHLRTCYTNIDRITAHFPTPTKNSPI